MTAAYALRRQKQSRALVSLFVGVGLRRCFGPWPIEDWREVGILISKSVVNPDYEGGAYGIRTRDLLNAIEALYQLS